MIKLTARPTFKAAHPNRAGWRERRTEAANQPPPAFARWIMTRYPTFQMGRRVSRGGNPSLTHRRCITPGLKAKPVPAWTSSLIPSPQQGFQLIHHLLRDVPLQVADHQLMIQQIDREALGLPDSVQDRPRLLPQDGDMLRASLFTLGTL